MGQAPLRNHHPPSPLHGHLVAFLLPHSAAPESVHKYGSCLEKWTRGCGQEAGAIAVRLGACENSEVLELNLARTPSTAPHPSGLCPGNQQPGASSWSATLGTPVSLGLSFLAWCKILLSLGLQCLHLGNKTGCVLPKSVKQG